jgi:alpha-glucosidase
MKMSDDDWWRGAAIYQIYLQSFFDKNDDGIGDLPGLIDHLDYVAALGVDAIWITPFYPSPMADFGYDVANYCDVDPRYGTLADFDALVARGHALGLKIVIDQVWSHTAADHPWFRQSQTSRANDKADWYVWADPAADGGPPNNWLSVFGGSAWRWAPERRQYYLHHFLPSQPKLNLRDERVLEAHFANAQFWLARGVDGFRLDAVDFMLHDEALRDNPPLATRDGQPPWNPFRLQRHFHDMCQSASQELMSRIRRFTDRYPGTITIGEISSEVGALDRIAKMTGGTKLHMAYTLGVMKSAFTPSTIRAAIGEAATLNRSGWLCWSFSNHDVERVVSRWNPDGIHPAAFARLELALLACLPGSICLYQGEELGLPQARLPFEAIRDPFGHTFYPAYAGRDGARTPMPWHAGTRHSGFSRAEQTWLPVAASHDALAIDRQKGDQDSTLTYCSRMLRYRKSHLALMLGEIELIALPDPLVAWRRRHDGDRIVAVFNLSSEPVTISVSQLPPFKAATELGFVIAAEDGQLRLPPFGVSVGEEHGNGKRR